MKNPSLKRLFFSLIMVLGTLFAFQNVRAQSSAPLVMVLQANGEVAPAMRDYLDRGLNVAVEQNAELVVIELNTPGGLIDSMTDIVAHIRASRIPVVVFVTPSGGMAGSAGTLITLAGHAAAMSPETIIGAATPVGSQGQDLDATMKAKEVQALTALVRSIASQRSPEAVQMAQDTIEISRAVSANEARDAQLVDFIAVDLSDLLKQMDGYSVQMSSGLKILHTANATIKEVPMDMGEEILDFLTKTDIVFILLAIGLLAILIELSAPGGWVAGFIGVVSLALAIYGMGVMSVNWFGMIFLLLAFVLFILDIKMPTHGALTVSGIGAFILGSLVLFNSPGIPEFQHVSVPLVVSVAIIMGAIFAVILGFALRAQKLPVRTGQQTLIGAAGVAKTDIAPSGQVQVHSELWSAELAADAGAIRAGEKIIVSSMEGLRLKVRKG